MNIKCTVTVDLSEKGLAEYKENYLLAYGDTLEDWNKNIYVEPNQKRLLASAIRAELEHHACEGIKHHFDVVGVDLENDQPQVIVSPGMQTKIEWGH